MCQPHDGGMRDAGPGDGGNSLGDAGCPDGGCLGVTDGGGCDASKGWHGYAGNPVLAHAPAALDGIPGDPTVVAEGNGYLMFYGAARGDFSDPLLRIFRATSTDGIVWQRSDTPVFSPAGSAAWDGTNVETPWVMRRSDGSLAMYYSGNGNSSDVGFQIGFATSPDGVQWTRLGTSPVLATTSTELSLIGPSVVHDKFAGVYVMLYGAITTAYTIDIRRATSPDGVNWTRHGTVVQLDNVERESPNDVGVMGPELIKTSTGYEMVYNSLIAPGVDGGMARSGGIYYARSTDAQSWTKLGSLYQPTRGNAFDATETGAQAWLRTQGGYRLWYVGTNTDYATTFDNGIGLLERACP